MAEQSNKVTRGLRRWFIAHFVVDILFAVPLMFIPEIFLPWFGWQTIDPVMPRLVAAALIGIGVESLLGRNRSDEVFRAMLNLKLLWASSAILAIGLGIINGAPWQAFVFLVIFLLFLIVWAYYRFILRG